MKTDKKIGFYLRSATGNLVDLKNQLKILNRELIRREFDQKSCLIEVYRDGHQSGIHPGPEFERLCRDVKHGKIDLVMVARTNRVSRSPLALLVFRDLLKSHSVDFISADGNEYCSRPSPSGQIALSIDFKNVRDQQPLTERGHK